MVIISCMLGLDNTFFVFTEETDAGSKKMVLFNHLLFSLTYDFTFRQPCMRRYFTWLGSWGLTLRL